MKEAVYDIYTAVDFEEKWVSFIEKIELENNDWLSGLYKERQRWVPALLRKSFWTGMSTTQRSESIHAFLDGYINSTTSLGQFVKQYANALRNKAEKEFEADFKSMDTIIPCGSTSSIEMQFQCAYTHGKFKEVQTEFRTKMNCVPSLESLEGCIATYNVLEELLVGDRPKERYFKVVFNVENHDIECEYSLFEFRGIMCRHVLCVCAKERVSNVPDKYVLFRWKKNVKRKHSYIKINYGVKELKPQMERFEKLSKRFYEVAEVAAESEYGTEAFHKLLDPSMDNVKRSLNEESIPSTGLICHSPLKVKHKGRPPTNRKISTVEKVIKKSQKKRTKRPDDKKITKAGNVVVGDHEINREITVEVMTDGDVMDAATLVCVKYKIVLTL